MYTFILIWWETAEIPLYTKAGIKKNINHKHSRACKVEDCKYVLYTSSVYKSNTRNQLRL